ncbi:LysR family transcriptional regulator [Microbispora sp. NPDC046933]|uniref:LysR family transcriptional regulator n=1 Tax=Microbispora sp. NPDC046933 TaxID=3155618 RepID=UPI0033E3EDE3
MGLGSTDLNLLVALEALLEEGNVTRAGARLGMSQPTMSGALARLRRHYKDDLLVRVGREYELTPVARSMLPVVQDAVRRMERALGLGVPFHPPESRRVFTVAMSDYAITVLNEPLLRRIQELAPEVCLDLSPIPENMHESQREMLRFDFLVAPRGYGFRGDSEVVFRDRFVCVVDPRNERLRDGTLTIRDLEELPHAVPLMGGPATMTPADRMVEQLGMRRRVQVTAAGWLSVPFVVAGTDLVAIVPERLALRVAGAARVRVVEPPFGELGLVEALWWHPSRNLDDGHQWLLGVFRDVARTLGERAACAA